MTEDLSSPTLTPPMREEKYKCDRPGSLGTAQQWSFTVYFLFKYSGSY